MLTPEERLRQVSAKIERAKKHTADLKTELDSFLKTDPYAVGSKHDRQTRKLIYYVMAVKSIPECFSIIAGDILQNLMSALDHLAYQIVCNDTGDNPPNPTGIYFPIGNSAAHYNAVKSGKITGAQKETFDAIDAIEPYKGGKGGDLLWSLWRLNNIEKHRLLLTVGSQAAGVNLGQLVSGHLACTFHPEAVAAIEDMGIFLQPADKGFPLQAGFELYIGAPEEKPNPKQQFRFDIALNELGIIEGESLFNTTRQFTDVAESVVTALKPRLGF
jgi:hypothetical protein